MAAVVLRFPVRDCSGCESFRNLDDGPWCGAWMEPLSGPEASLAAEGCDHYAPGPEGQPLGGNQAPARLYDLQRHVRGQLRAADGQRRLHRAPDGP